MNLEELCAEAIFYFNIGNNHRALKLFDDVLKIDPNHIHANYKKGCSLMNLGKYEDSLNHFNKVIQLDPENKEALFKRGILFYKIRDYDKCFYDFEILSTQEKEGFKFNDDYYLWKKKVNKIKHQL